MRNFNDIFNKHVSYNNIKSHKNQGFYSRSKKTVLEKPQGGGQINSHSLFRVNFKRLKGSRENATLSP